MRRQYIKTITIPPGEMSDRKYIVRAVKSASLHTSSSQILLEQTNYMNEQVRRLEKQNYTLEKQQALLHQAVITNFKTSEEIDELREKLADADAAANHRDIKAYYKFFSKLYRRRNDSDDDLDSDDDEDDDDTDSVYQQNNLPPKPESKKRNNQAGSSSFSQQPFGLGTSSQAHRYVFNNSNFANGTFDSSLSGQQNNFEEKTSGLRGISGSGQQNKFALPQKPPGFRFNSALPGYGAFEETRISTPNNQVTVQTTPGAVFNNQVPIQPKLGGIPTQTTGISTQATPLGTEIPIQPILDGTPIQTTPVPIFNNQVPVEPTGVSTQATLGGIPTQTTGISTQATPDVIPTLGTEIPIQPTLGPLGTGDLIPTGVSTQATPDGIPTLGPEIPIQPTPGPLGTGDLIPSLLNIPPLDPYVSNQISGLPGSSSKTNPVDMDAYETGLPNENAGSSNDTNPVDAYETGLPNENAGSSNDTNPVDAYETGLPRPYFPNENAGSSNETNPVIVLDEDIDMTDPTIDGADEDIDMTNPTIDGAQISIAPGTSLDYANSATSPKAIAITSKGAKASASSSAQINQKPTTPQVQESNIPTLPEIKEQPKGSLPSTEESANSTAVNDETAPKGPVRQVKAVTPKKQLKIPSPLVVQVPTPLKTPPPPDDLFQFKTKVALERSGLIKNLEEKEIKRQKVLQEEYRFLQNQLVLLPENAYLDFLNKKIKELNEEYEVDETLYTEEAMAELQKEYFTKLQPLQEKTRELTQLKFEKEDYLNVLLKRITDDLQRLSLEEDDEENNPKKRPISSDAPPIVEDKRRKRKTKRGQSKSTDMEVDEMGREFVPSKFFQNINEISFDEDYDHQMDLFKLKEFAIQVPTNAELNQIPALLLLTPEKRKIAIENLIEKTPPRPTPKKVPAKLKSILAPSEGVVPAQQFSLQQKYQKLINDLRRPTPKQFDVKELRFYYSLIYDIVPLNPDEKFGPYGLRKDSSVEGPICSFQPLRLGVDLNEPADIAIFDALSEEYNNQLVTLSNSSIFMKYTEAMEYLTKNLMASVNTQFEILGRSIHEEILDLVIDYYQYRIHLLYTIKEVCLTMDNIDKFLDYTLNFKTAYVLIQKRYTKKLENQLEILKKLLTDIIQYNQSLLPK